MQVYNYSDHICLLYFVLSPPPHVDTLLLPNESLFIYRALGDPIRSSSMDNLPVRPLKKNFLPHKCP